MSASGAPEYIVLSVLRFTDSDYLDLQLLVQSVPITTHVRIPRMARCTQYNIMWWSLTMEMTMCVSSTYANI
jgi:hypothetical protein